MYDREQDIGAIRNAGTLTEDERDKILDHVWGNISATFKNFTDRYGVKGYDNLVIRLFSLLLQPYVTFNVKIEPDIRQLKKLHVFLSLNNRVAIIELLDSISDLPAYIDRKFDERDVKKIILWFESAIEQLYKSCFLFKRGSMYSTNMYKLEIENWLNNLRIKYNPEITKIQKDLRTPEINLNEYAELQKKISIASIISELGSPAEYHLIDNQPGKTIKIQKFITDYPQALNSEALHKLNTYLQSGRTVEMFVSKHNDWANHLQENQFADYRDNDISFRHWEVLERWKAAVNNLLPKHESETIRKSAVDFIRGSESEFVARNESGYFIVYNDGAKRKYTIESFFDSALRNWEFEIDKALTKEEKVHIANTAIFKFRKDYLVEETHPLIITTIEKKVRHLKHIIEYLSSDFTEASLPEQPKAKAGQQVSEKNYSLRQIAIAQFILGITIDESNAAKLLEDYSKFKSVKKLLSKRFSRADQLTKITEHKTTDTKFLKDLYAAKRLLSGKKNKNAITDITRIITTFQTNFNKHY